MLNVSSWVAINKLAHVHTRADLLGHRVFFVLFFSGLKMLHLKNNIATKKNTLGMATLLITRTYWTLFLMEIFFGHMF